MKLACALLLVSAIVSVDARPQFVNKVPNGANMEGVSALGHKDKTGASEDLNKFGAAFDKAGRSWTVELCQADSDGDGQTNGQEIGDPCCTWSVGGTPSYKSGLSHPGDASSKADSSLWADIKCSGSSNSSSSAVTPSSTTKAPSASDAASFTSLALLACATSAVVVLTH